MAKTFLKIAGLLAFIISLGSCTSTRQLQYMQGAFDTAKLSSYNLPEPIIQQGDLLGIVVFSESPAATAIYNQSGATSTLPSATNSAAETGGVTSGSVSPAGYLVDPEGNIQMQSIGKVHVEGLTKAQLAALLESKLKTYLTNPYTSIRFLNFKITLIGDIAHPGVYSIPSERVNLLEAIGLAGDLNVTARRDNIRIIREQNGKREFGVIDLTKPDIFTSRFYQLQQNDIVYVDLTKNKASQNDQTTIRNIGLAATIVSTIAIVITVLKR